MVSAEGYGAPVERGARALDMPDRVWRAIRAHGEKGYPLEICGALLGKAGANARRVEEIFPIENARDANKETRYVITPENIMAAEKECRRLNLDLLGFYHSHPDHPAKPSEYDREHAWPWYSYVIVSVINGKAGEVTSWQLKDDRAAFLTESLEVVS